MPCKKEENGTLSRAQRVLAHFAEARRRKSLRSRIKTENGKLIKGDTMEMSYKEAIAEIEAILKSLREEQNNIDSLSERVARATELIALCRKKLLKAEADVNKIIEG